jgi:phage/plasmid-associated DNA primase
VDNSGSINRRIVLFEFPKRVHDGDMQLGKKIEQSITSILVKSNRAYLQAVHRYARNNIWKHLPAAFHAAKEAFSENSNSLVSFLRSGSLEFGHCNVVYMPHDHFVAAYNSYVESMGLKKIAKFTNDAISQPLLEAGCRMVTGKQAAKQYPRPAPASASASASASNVTRVGSRGRGGPVIQGRWIMGCDIAPRNNNGDAFASDSRDDDDGLDIDRK